MKFGSLRILASLVTLTVFGSCPLGSSSMAASAAPALLKAKQEAEAKGYIFEISRDDIIAKAKKEGRLRVIGSLDKQTLKALSEAFKKKYPFIDAQAEEVAGTEVYMRIIQEMKAGLAKGWDVNYLAFDFYNDYLPYQKKFDILGMAKQGVLKIPLSMIDPNQRHVVVVASDLQVVAFNKKLISEEKIPETWEGFLKPEFVGRKFILDIRPKDVAALVPAWGLEKAVGFARKLAAQKPVWMRGNTRALAMLQAGEHAIAFGPNFASVLRTIDKDRGQTIDYKILEPVPTRLNEAQGILSTADHPFSALLWLEFLCSSEGQRLMDEHEPYGASLLASDSVQAKAIRGKQLSVLGWEHYTKMGDYQKKLVEAYGFPRAETKK